MKTCALSASLARSSRSPTPKLEVDFQLPSLVLVAALEGDVETRAVVGLVAPDGGLDGAESNFVYGFGVAGHDVFSSCLLRAWSFPLTHRQAEVRRALTGGKAPPRRRREKSRHGQRGMTNAAGEAKLLWRERCAGSIAAPKASGRMNSGTSSEKVKRGWPKCVDPDRASFRLYTALSASGSQERLPRQAEGPRAALRPLGRSF